MDNGKRRLCFSGCSSGRYPRAYEETDQALVCFEREWERTREKKTWRVVRLLLFCSRYLPNVSWMFLVPLGNEHPALRTWGRAMLLCAFHTLSRQNALTCALECNPSFDWLVSDETWSEAIYCFKMVVGGRQSWLEVEWLVVSKGHQKRGPALQVALWDMATDIWGTLVI